MKKLFTPSNVVAIIFTFIGLPFSVIGVMAMLGHVTMSEESQLQNHMVFGRIFFAIGIVFFVSGITLAVISIFFARRGKKLLETGYIVNGIVTMVEHVTNVRINRCYPYRIHFKYYFEGTEFYGKSSLLWDRPNIAENNSISVYTDGKGNSAVDYR